MLNILKTVNFEQNCFVSLLDPSNWNSSEEARIKAVTDIASITTGRLGYPDDYNRIKLYNRLLTESAGKPSTPFEFIPIRLHQETLDKFGNELLDIDIDTWCEFCKYCTIKNDLSTTEVTYYTNLRNCLNLKDGIHRTYNGYLDQFKVIVGQVPKQVYDHIVMHRSFSRISESSRNKRYLKEVEFWIDSKQSLELQEMEKYDNEQSIKRAFAYIEKGMKPEQATKRLPCTRLIKFALGAWIQDENSWQNLFDVRSKHSGTQEITQQTIDNIKSLIL
jgi:thymidylate synthase (FAD)